MGIKRNNFIPVSNKVEGSRNFNSADIGFYNRIETTAPMTLTLDSNVSFPQFCEIIIRNPATSTDNITIAASGFTIDVSGDLGLVIPPGGIGELKRVDNSIWDFYGYIST